MGEEGKKKVRFNRKAFFHGDVDSDEASLDNGDDTNLLQLWAGMQTRHQSPPSEAGSHSEIGDLGEAVDVTQAPAEADNSAADETEPDASTSTENPASMDTNTSFPALPHVTPMDEKYMPAIMDKLIKMRDEMMTLKGANWEEILETHRDGVVQIMVVKKKFLWKAAYRSPMSEEISGSGWFINNNEFSVHTQQDLLVVTNAHVAKNAAEINILIPSLGQEPIPAEVVGLCSQRDIAILRVVDKEKLLETYKTKTGKVDIVRLRLGDSDEMKRGARCIAVGYPLGLKSVKASMGIVSGYQQFKSALYLQTTAPINPGNSGGPLFNQDGKVVGINSAKIASASGMSFAIASVQLKVMLDVLFQRREFIVPFLGYSFSVGTKLIQKYLKVKPAGNTGGIYVTDVQPNGLFQQAGVKKGDLVLTIDGATIDRFGQTWMPTMKDNINVLGLLARKKVGTPLSIGVWRKKEQRLKILKAKYDETPKFAIPFVYEPLLTPPKFEIFAGVVMMELSVNLVTVLLQNDVAGLMKYMQPKKRLKPRVIIASVVPGSLAFLDGSVKPGLLVEQINGQPITSMSDVCKVLSNKPKKWYTISTSQTFSVFKVSQIAASAKAGMGTPPGSFCSPKKPK